MDSSIHSLLIARHMQDRIEEATAQRPRERRRLAPRRYVMMPRS